MHQLSIEQNLQQIRKGIFSNTQTQTQTENTTAAINNFQNDPALLSPHLPSFIKTINNSFILAIDNTAAPLPHAKAQLFYTLAKICSIKIVIKHLSTDIHHLNSILSLLSNTSHPWQTHYFLLAWCNIIIQSPFNIVDDTLIYNTTLPFKSNLVLNPLIAMIHSTLYQKNYPLFESHTNNNPIDPLTLNCFLKTQLSEHSSNIIHNPSLLNELTLRCLHSSPSPSSSSHHIITLKMLPKLFLLQSWNGNWDILSQIIQWYHSHLDSPFTEVRFTLAHSYSKVLSHMINKLNGTTHAIQCIESLVNDLLHLITSTPTDILDFNTFHTYLLLIAECSTHIISLTPQFLTIITNDILPVAYSFQQLHMNNMIKSSQVKDAANFIVWSWAKYSHGSILPNATIYDLVKLLVVTTLFDRDFLIRKSSNAALQELLGRHGHSIFNNNTIMQLIQLPIHNLHQSFNNNLIKLYNILPHSQNHSHLFPFIIDWLLKYNIMTNFDLDIVMSSVTALCHFHTSIPNYPLLPFIANWLKETNQTTIKPYPCSRIVFLLTKLPVRDIDPFSKQLTTLSQIIEIDKFKSNLNPNDYFQCLTLLNYWHYQLEKYHNFPFLLDRIDSFYKIVSTIAEDSPWFDQFKIATNQIFNKLDEQNDTLVPPMVWNQFENCLKSNKPLIVSSLPMLSPQKFSSLYNRYKFILTCQSKSLIISTLTHNIDSFMKLLQFADDDDDQSYIDIIIDWLNDHTITEQGDVGRLTREAACQLVATHYHRFNANDLKEKLIPTLLYLAIEPSQNVRRLCFNILTHLLSDHLPKTFSLEDHKTSHTILLLNLQLSFHNDNISRNFFKHFFTYAGALHTTEEELMTGIDDFIQWYNNLDELAQRNTLNNIIITIPSYQDIKIDKSLMKYTICGVKFLERIWCSRCACGYDGFNWDGIFAKFYNITLLRNKQLLGAILQVLPTLAIAWKESLEVIQDYSFINKLIQFLVKLINTNTNDDKPKSELTPIQRNGIESLVALLLEFQEIDKATYINNFIENYQLNSLLQTTKLLL